MADCDIGKFSNVDVEHPEVFGGKNGQKSDSVDTSVIAQLVFKEQIVAKTIFA